MKSYFEKYINYVKDNPEGYWFKRKLFGWGWAPVSREGWGIIVLFIVIIVWNAHRLDVDSQSVSDTVRPFLIQTFILTFILLAICYKTGEKPRWTWGIPKNPDETEGK